jgi:hypothetical protein
LELSSTYWTFNADGEKNISRHIAAQLWNFCLPEVKRGGVFADRSPGPAVAAADDGEADSLHFRRVAPGHGGSLHAFRLRFAELAGHFRRLNASRLLQPAIRRPKGLLMARALALKGR